MQEHQRLKYGNKMNLVADVVWMWATFLQDVIMPPNFGKEALSWHHQSQMTWTWLIQRFFCRQGPTCIRLMESPWHLGCADIITNGIPWTWDVPTYYHQGWPPAASSSCPPTPEQRGSSGGRVGVAACGRAAVAAQYCCVGCCYRFPATGCYNVLPLLLPLLEQRQQ